MDHLPKIRVRNVESMMDLQYTENAATVHSDSIARPSEKNADLQPIDFDTLVRLSEPQNSTYPNLFSSDPENYQAGKSAMQTLAEFCVLSKSGTGPNENSVQNQGNSRLDNRTVSGNSYSSEFGNNVVSKGRPSRLVNATVSGCSSEFGNNVVNEGLLNRLDNTTVGGNSYSSEFTNNVVNRGVTSRMDNTTVSGNSYSSKFGNSVVNGGPPHSKPMVKVPNNRNQQDGPGVIKYGATNESDKTRTRRLSHEELSESLAQLSETNTSTTTLKSVLENLMTEIMSEKVNKMSKSSDDFPKLKKQLQENFASRVYRPACPQKNSDVRNHSGMKHNSTNKLSDINEPEAAGLKTAARRIPPLEENSNLPNFDEIYAAAQKTAVRRRQSSEKKSNVPSNSLLKHNYTNNSSNLDKPVAAGQKTAVRRIQPKMKPVRDNTEPEIIEVANFAKPHIIKTDVTPPPAHSQQNHRVNQPTSSLQNHRVNKPNVHQSSNLSNIPPLVQYYEQRPTTQVNYPKSVPESSQNIASNPQLQQVFVVPAGATIELSQTLSAQPEMDPRVIVTSNSGNGFHQAAMFAQNQAISQFPCDLPPSNADGTTLNYSSVGSSIILPPGSNIGSPHAHVGNSSYIVASNSNNSFQQTAGLMHPQNQAISNYSISIPQCDNTKSVYYGSSPSTVSSIPTSANSNFVSVSYASAQPPVSTVYQTPNANTTYVVSGALPPSVSAKHQDINAGSSSMLTCRIKAPYILPKPNLNDRVNDTSFNREADKFQAVHRNMPTPIVKPGPLSMTNRIQKNNLKNGDKALYMRHRGTPILRHFEVNETVDLTMESNNIGDNNQQSNKKKPNVEELTKLRDTVYEKIGYLPSSGILRISRPPHYTNPLTESQKTRQNVIIEDESDSPCPKSKKATKRNSTITVLGEDNQPVTVGKRRVIYDKMKLGKTSYLLPRCRVMLKRILITGTTVKVNNTNLEDNASASTSVNNDSVKGPKQYKHQLSTTNIASASSTVVLPSGCDIRNISRKTNEAANVDVMTIDEFEHRVLVNNTNLEQNTIASTSMNSDPRQGGSDVNISKKPNKVVDIDVVTIDDESETFDDVTNIPRLRDTDGKWQWNSIVFDNCFVKLERLENGEPVRSMPQPRSEQPLDTVGFLETLNQLRTEKQVLCFKCGKIQPTDQFWLNVKSQELSCLRCLFAPNERIKPVTFERTSDEIPRRKKICVIVDSDSE